MGMAVEILYTFVGNHDPLTLPGPDEDPGPVGSLVRSRSFDHLVLLISGPQYAERAVVVQQAASRLASPPTCTLVQMPLDSPVDYEEIYTRLSATIPSVERDLPYHSEEIARFVLLDPGTPQMQTVWFLMVRSGRFPATLLQGIPARFGGGRYRAREVSATPSWSLDRATDQTPAAGTSADGTSATGTSPAGPATAQHSTDRTGPADSWAVETPTILGSSSPVTRMISQIEAVAGYDITILIIGESGTGKELVARYLHTLSPRRRAPFLAVNCAAMSAGTIESELFGHEKGAFTGAAAQRNGVFRSAHGGTLFLDEVGELPPALQAKLLRVIEYGEVTPVGADTPVYVDVRIVAATNRELAEMVADGSFRGDLYERLRQLEIPVPPLRVRGDDVRRLAEAFLADWVAQHGRHRHFTPAALAAIEAYEWPRNVRQLKNLVTQACIFSPGPTIDADAVTELIDAAKGDHGWQIEPTDDRAPDGSAAGAPRLAGDAAAVAETAAFRPDFPVDLPQLLRETEGRWYAAALEAAGGNRAHAARLLGINPPALRKALKERFPDLTATTP